MTRIFLYGLIGMGFIILAFTSYFSGFIIPGVILAVFSPISLYTVKRNLPWASSAALALVTITSAFLVTKGASPFWALSAILCSLAAWDLSDFQVRLRLAHAEDTPATLERNHLLRLFFTLLAGFVFSWAALTFKITLNFDRVIILILLGIAGLGLLIHFLRQVD